WCILKRLSWCVAGFQVVGGENSGRKDLGTLISSLTPGGPAEVDGCLKPGDRLISVNGKNLEGLSHSATVDVLQNTPDDVTLVVSQPGSVVSIQENYMTLNCLK
uniref:PDZ domain-containing protein n=1 Tax=Oryzias latipes TaxID=8090 RepID=A0A3P9LRX0_ORYLA